jgi:hypothetical protein
LQVTLQDTTISSNTVTQGLLWLRLVNTSMTNVTVTGNLATGSSSSSNSMSAGNTTAAAAAAAAGDVSPPSPCDPGALHRAMVQVHGPAAFDVHRCAADMALQGLAAPQRIILAKQSKWWSSTVSGVQSTW